MSPTIRPLPPSDEDLVEKLIAIDQDEDLEVGDWEAGFLETIVRRHKQGLAPRLSPKQREAALKLIEKYGGTT